jgi:hypothetical protein
MQSINYNLRYAAAILEQFEKYLLSREVFWNLGVRTKRGETPFPDLSPGNLYLVLNQLETQQPEMTTIEIKEYARLRLLEIEARREWPAALERKSSEELSIRINLWRNYLADLANQESNSNSSRTEIKHRVIINLLQSVGACRIEDSATRVQIQGLDDRFWRYYQAGEFLWDPALRVHYSEPEYPFLYSEPRSEQRV